MSSSLLIDLPLMHTVRRSQDKVFFAGNLVLAFVMGILCLRRFYRHCKVVLTGVSRVVILQTGSSFQFCMGNVSLSIAALGHAKNLPELETWFRDMIILE